MHVSKALRYLLPLVIFLVLAFFLFRGLYLNPREVPSPLIGKPVPDFRVPLLNQPDKTLASADLRGQFSAVGFHRLAPFLGNFSFRRWWTFRRWWRFPADSLRLQCEQPLPAIRDRLFNHGGLITPECGQLSLGGR